MENIHDKVYDTDENSKNLEMISEFDWEFVNATKVPLSWSEDVLKMLHTLIRRFADMHFMYIIEKDGKMDFRWTTSRTSNGLVKYVIDDCVKALQAKGLHK